MSDAVSNLEYTQRVQHWRGKIPDRHADDYDELLSEGCAPRLAAATIDYVHGHISQTDPPSQAEIADDYGITESTISKWYPKIAPELKEYHIRLHSSINESETQANTQSSTNTTATRKALYILYNSEAKYLTRIEISNRSDYAMGTLGEALRELTSSGHVGSRLVDNGKKEYWAVPRADTPEYQTECRRSEMPKYQSVAEICETLGWNRRSTAYAERDKDAECIISESRTGKTGHITNQGLIKLTGKSDKLAQIERLRQEFGLEPGEDLTISFKLTSSGAYNLYQTIAKGDANE